MKCKHKTVHTEKTKWFPAQVIQYPRCTPFEIPERKAEVITICADCGLELKRVELLTNNK